MKKKKILANGIMVAVIVAVVAAGVLLVGRYRGWFDHSGDTALTACAVRDKGVADLTRGGMATHLTDTAALRDGDKLSTHKGAQVSVSFGESCLMLGESASLTVDRASAGQFAVTVLSGEVFLCAGDAATIRFGGQTATAANSTVALSVRTGSESIGVLSGQVTVDEKTLSAGETAAFSAGSAPVYTALAAASLSDFLLHCAIDADGTLCFTDAALRQVLSDRRSQTAAVSEHTGSGAAEGSGHTAASGGEDASRPSGGSGGAAGSTPTKPDAAPAGDANDEKPDTAGYTCTIEIRCDTILDNMDNLAPGKDGYVPADGVILAATSVSFTDGETVFDVLKRVCGQYDIPLEYSYTPLYESYYVEGIHHLYEFDCGSESGWMYQVNGWFPNYGCSAYSLSQGDTIVWCYTCNGLGADVGGSVY